MEGFLIFECTRLDHWPMTNLDKIVEAIEPVPPVSVVLAVSEEDTQMISVNNRKQTTSLRLRGPDTSCLIIICIDWDPIWTDHCIRMYFSGFHGHFTIVPFYFNRISCCENPLRVCRKLDNLCGLPEPDESGLYVGVWRPRPEAHGWILANQPPSLAPPGRQLIVHRLEECQQHHNEECCQEGVVHDVEGGYLH